MKRFSFTRAMERSKGMLTTFPDSAEFSAQRRRVMMDIAALRLVRSKLDYLSGLVEAFIMENGTIVIRQHMIMLKEPKVHWYHVAQGGIYLIDNHQQLEDEYENRYTMG